MKYSDNLSEVTKVQPDYVGFIFYEQSPRYMVDALSPEDVLSVPASIQRVGVFVNASTDHILLMAERYGLHALQLHGHESPAQCQDLKDQGYTVIKVVSVGQEGFDVDKLSTYQPYVDFFLFDTKGKQPGGNGETFDWELLHQYTLSTPFFLSGGIGPNEIDALRRLSLPYLHALDVNSRFEIAPGRKDPEALAAFSHRLSHSPV